MILAIAAVQSPWRTFWSNGIVSHTRRGECLPAMAWIKSCEWLQVHGQMENIIIHYMENYELHHKYDFELKCALVRRSTDARDATAGDGKIRLLWIACIEVPLAATHLLIIGAGGVVVVVVPNELWIVQMQRCLCVQFRFSLELIRKINKRNRITCKRNRAHGSYMSKICSVRMIYWEKRMQATQTEIADEIESSTPSGIS